MILQGQNDLLPTFLDKAKWPVCLGRIRLPTLPLTRLQAPGTAVYLGERALPVEKPRRGYVELLKHRERNLIIDRAKVALRVTNLCLDFNGPEQWIWGVVESCGIRPNLRSIVNEERRSKLCFMPRLVVEPSKDVPRAMAILKLVTFDLCDYEEDPV